MSFVMLGKPNFLIVASSKIRAQLLPLSSFSSLYSSVARCSSSAVNKYVRRSHTCGELGSADVGKSVTLCGWLEYQRLDKFGVLRDGYGSIQLLVPDENKKVANILEKLNLESVIKVKGVVFARPENQENSLMKTGDVEVVVEDIDVLNIAKANLPFLIRGANKAKEALRMKYRYLDLRFPQMQRNLRLRSKMTMKMREFLVNECGFVEVETPTLFKKTPGGAREFIVPTHSRDQYYSLVQSPQQLKQLLMVGSIDRYFQVARCYRDEGARRDRQPEFTQLDIELSFIEQEDIFPLIENLLAYSWPSDQEPLSIPFPRLKYADVMERYGSDKPDISFGAEINDQTSHFVDSINKSEVLKKKFGTDSETVNIHSVIFPKTAEHHISSIQKRIEKISKEYFPDVILLQLAILENDSWVKKLEKIFPDVSLEKFMEKLGVSNGDLVFLAFGKKERNLKLLGQARLEYAELLALKKVEFGKDPAPFNFVWITDFPLFTKDEESGRTETTHHPFTQPHPDDMPLLQQEPLKVRGLHYDLVLNGAEVGGGSIRIHSHRLQRQVLENILDIPTTSLEHLLDALHCGCPPHGGIALGLDRLFSIICGENTIRDVIAFPKTFESRDLMVGTPCDIPEDDKIYYHQKIRAAPEDREPPLASPDFPQE